jgi:DNA-binding HxlR family transcriptional regulator
MLDSAQGPYCPSFHRGIEFLGSRWTGAIIRAMLQRITRFSDLKAAIPGISDKMLSERLKELEAAGIVYRTVLPLSPVRIDYRLTEAGEALVPVMEAVSIWSDEWLESGGAVSRRL